MSWCLKELQEITDDRNIQFFTISQVIMYYLLFFNMGFW